jgi:hypothetical protein
MFENKPKTKILVDGGDPEGTLRVKELIGVADGQTTNPRLIAKNPEIRKRIASDHTLTPHEEKDEYRRISATKLLMRVGSPWSRWEEAPDRKSLHEST